MLTRGPHLYVIPALVAMVWPLLAADPSPPSAPPEPRPVSHDLIVQRVLDRVPLFDGHNDLPWSLRKRFDGRLDAHDLHDTTHLHPPMHTDITRMKDGGIGAQFWSVFVPVSLEKHRAVQTTFEQIDLVHRLSDRYPDTFEVALTAADVERIHASGKIASLIGIEGGHSIGNSLAILRRMYAAGARYMTLTHWKAHDWADAATDEPRHDGMTEFGREVVREMNRLGMLVDLSHVSFDVMRQSLDVTEAPVIFSHSGAWEVCNHVRNVPDDVLLRLKDNGGIVMVDFLEAYVSDEVRLYHEARRAEHARLSRKHKKKQKKIDAAMAAWKAANPAPRSTLAQVADHIDHVRNLIGVDHIGIGSDFDGMRSAPIGLEDASKYPALLKELLARGYAEHDLCKIVGLNALRVMRHAEAVAARLQKERLPSEELLPGEPSPAKPIK